MLNFHNANIISYHCGIFLKTENDFAWCLRLKLVAERFSASPVELLPLEESSSEGLVMDGMRTGILSMEYSYRSL